MLVSVWPRMRKLNRRLLIQILFQEWLRWNDLGHDSWEEDREALLDHLEWCSVTGTTDKLHPQGTQMHWGLKAKGICLIHLFDGFTSVCPSIYSSQETWLISSGSHYECSSDLRSNSLPSCNVSSNNEITVQMTFVLVDRLTEMKLRRLALRRRVCMWCFVQ